MYGSGPHPQIPYTGPPIKVPTWVFWLLLGLFALSLVVAGILASAQ